MEAFSPFFIRVEMDWQHGQIEWTGFARFSRSDS